MKKNDLLAIFLILAALGIVFFDLFTLQSAFLSGDHRDQQYPWAKFYQQEIHQGRLPWWTSAIQCGFPLLAEGQIGAFYPLNFLFFYFLPLAWAYNYIILFQYLLGGILFYAFLLRLKISRWGSFFASLIYLFGSAQGGYFYYNYISQKTVIWLPLTLILIDRLIERRKFADSFWLASVFAVQVFAGYLQVALYSVLFSSVYFFLRLKFSPERKKPLLLFIFSGILALFFSLPQLLPTYELARLSSRAGAVSGLAYVGSMLPVGFMTVFYPSWDAFLGSEWYLGLPGLFMAFILLFTKKVRDEKIFLLFTGLFLLLALGGYSPLYRALVAVSGFQGFRTPIKFLFFVSFSCAVLAGFGFDRFFKSAGPETDKWKSRALHAFLWIGSLALSLPVLIPVLSRAFRSKLLPFFQGIVVDHFYGKAGHPLSQEAYRDKAASFYSQVSAHFSLAEHATRLSFMLLAIFLLGLFFSRKANLSSFAAKLSMTLFLFADLVLYGFTSIRPNLISYTEFNARRGKIVDYLTVVPGDFKVTTFSPPAEMEKLPFYPNANMLYGFQDPGAYSPLVLKAYREKMGSLVYVNDSLSASEPEPWKYLKELGLLNVQFLITRQTLDSAQVDLLLSESGNHLYRNRAASGRAFLVSGESAPASLTELSQMAWSPVREIEIKEGETALSFTAAQDSWLIITESYYPGWQARLDGHWVKIHPGAGLFQSIQVPAGAHEVRLRYDPVFYRRCAQAALGVFSFLLIILVLKPFFKTRREAVPC